MAVLRTPRRPWHAGPLAVSLWRLNRHDVTFTVLTMFKRAVPWGQAHSQLCGRYHCPPQSFLSIVPNRGSVRIERQLPGRRPCPRHHHPTVSANVTPLGTSRKWNHVVFVVSFPAYFTERDFLKVRGRCSLC